MGLLEGVATVLANEGEPLKVNAITERLLAQGLWTSEGKTPAATVEARLAVDIKGKGTRSRFIRTAPGTFALRPSGVSQGAASSPPEPQPSPTHTAVSLSFTDAAERVLQELAGGQPMHYREITELALKRGWLSTAGQTPEATLYSQVYTEIERRKARGEQPRFYRLSKGLIGLSDWLPKGLAREIAEHNRTVKKELRQRLLGMPPGEFEALVGALLSEMGFVDVQVTRLIGDGGIDARAVLVVGESIRIRMAVQAKRWKHNVQAPVVQNVRGSLGAHDQGLIITTSDFGHGAREEASRPDRQPVGLLNGEELVNLLVAYGIGVERDTYDLLALTPNLIADE